MGIHSPSRKNRTLNSVQDLSDVTFGHKFPRHGLKLLHWLANEWIEFDSERQMLAKTDPETREFGFHIFHNMENILPPLLEDQSRYFEVGNLHAYGAEDLPFSEADTGSDGSNTDRIIVRMDSDHGIGEVYITEHTPYQNSFCFDSTYRISRGLIMHIQNLEESDFLQRAGYIPRKYESPRSESRETGVKIEQEKDSPRSRETVVKIEEEKDFPRRSASIWDIKHIQNLEESDILKQAGYIPRRSESPRSESRETGVNMQWAEDFPSQSWSICECVIL